MSSKTIVSWKQTLTVLGCLGLGLLSLALGGSTGCDTGSRNRDEGGFFVPGGTTGGTGGTGGGPIALPILFGFDQITADDTLCVGQVVTLRGINFSPDLRRNVVKFRFGSKAIDGVPLSVAFPVDTNASDGIDTLLRVMVPTGVTSGSLELEVNGFFAGAVGFIACPLIYSFELGVNRDEENLVNAPPVGFDPQIGPETIWLHGLNFAEVTEIVVEDRGGRRFVVPPTEFRRRRLTPSNGLDSLQFDLQNAKLNIAQPRDNLRVWVVANSVRSNAVSVPVQPLDSASRPLGPVINGVQLPNGVRTGPVRFLYSMYDRPVSMSYLMDIEWTVNGGNDWFPATLKLDDPISDGTQEDLPNIVLPGSQKFPSPSNFLRGGGARRFFTWDAPNDPEFRALNESLTPSGNVQPRNWSIQFRMSAVPSFNDGTTNRFDPGVLFVTPPVAYYDLQDRGGGDLSASRRGSFEEDFTTNNRRDDTLTTALWGPPFNQGALEGRLEQRAESPFGEGTLDLAMVSLDPDERPDNYVNEYYTIDTTRMQIDRVLVVDEDGVIIEDARRVFPTAAFPNDGEEDFEFHLRTLTIEEGMQVLPGGANPLVIKLSGRAISNIPGLANKPALADDEVAFFNGGNIIADGRDAADQTGAPGLLGSGAGGVGATVAVGFDGSVSSMTNATAGGLGGGGPGETPGAINPDTAQQSRFRGAPGGGGGSRRRGGDGDAGNTTPTTFPQPRGGRGGSIRGSEFLRPLVPGSGGGGGGASLIGQFPNFQTPTGGGGGSGGGAVKIAARGSILFSELATLTGNGGRGSDADINNAGPGGGGSGGCIFLQSTGFINLACESLQVSGGQPGDAGSQINREPGQGAGSPGWIRLETSFGGTPFCNFLPVEETVLTSDLRRSSSTSTIAVESAANFPDQGVILIGTEVITYTSKTVNSFGGVTRAVEGSDLQLHPQGTRVRLRATLEPAESYIGSAIQVSPEVIDTRLGLDQTLHCYFIPSRDPETGDVLLDQSGRPVSIWIFDTDEGTVFDPNGFADKVAIEASTNPGLLQLTRLIIDQGVTLRGVGSRPMEILVTETADIAGAIDVSGSPGGILRFSASNPSRPLPGLGGEAGAGGGRGGDGGTVIFLDGNVANRAPENIEIVPGQLGGLPLAVPDEFDVTPVAFGDSGPQNDLSSTDVVRATGGASRRDTSCENAPQGNTCQDTAGGGGGGGNLSQGSDGNSIPAGVTQGSGGSRIGTDNFRLDGARYLTAGGGGAGGGASAALSDDYLAGTAGSAVFRGAARYAPGTGGGGGGGILRLAVRGGLILRKTGAILANGGDARQSIDLGGNGGAGAGGSIFIQVANAFTIEPGARIQALGGRANRSVPREPGQLLPPYEGNIRTVGGTTVTRGGRGGDGSAGRVRIEAPRNAVTFNSGVINDNIFSGQTLTNGEPSVGVSVPFRLGLGPGRAVLSHAVEVTSETVRFGPFGLPQETQAVVLWQVAQESRDDHGEVGAFGFGTETLQDPLGIGFVRFEVRMVSNNITREVPAIQRIQLEYRLSQ